MSTAIIVPCRNEAGEIELLLKSILTHLKVGDTLIVVEGGSYDPTWEIVSNFASNNSNVVALQQKGTGKFDAVLTGIEIAKQHFIMVWDADGTVSFKDNLTIYDFEEKQDYLPDTGRLDGEPVWKVYDDKGKLIHTLFSEEQAEFQVLFEKQQGKTVTFQKVKQ